MTHAEAIGRRSVLLHPGLVASGATLLIAAFVSDVLYWRTLLYQWNNLSQWLVAGGMLMALLAAIAFVVDLLRGAVHRVAWLRFAGLGVAALLGFLNALVHSRDAYTAIVPQGLTLSAIVAALLLIVGLTGGWSLAHRRAVVVSHNPDVRP
ncbi:DUF2231 domain-containing protein [uncultured Alsobacter sp.]|uniref:DUF2231 domain-containing protein n=1 Tax=uncultured Alsobacter sp. TaxID=1748258 RepID=UPI0025D16127|nr:DUF2231 domain-containing protein [uncultured Alsobacter sp.]